MVPVDKLEGFKPREGGGRGGGSDSTHESMLLTQGVQGEGVQIQSTNLLTKLVGGFKMRL